MNKNKIIKNTIYMYMIMILSMLVSLYSSRLVLKNLGILDFGIYNLLAGVITMLSFLSGTMSSTLQRFIAYDIGKKNIDRVRELFSTGIIVHLLLGIVVLILAETIGVWFINNNLKIPTERLETANFVFHFIVLSFIIKVVTIPFEALFNSYEKLGYIGLLNLLNPIGRLSASILLAYTAADKLKIFSITIFAFTLIILILYALITKLLFKEIKFVRPKDKKLFKHLTSFAGWGLIGDLSAVSRGQGIAILLNLFFGAIINAAYGVAGQVTGQLRTVAIMVVNASAPQIIKTYSQSNMDKMYRLIYQATKIPTCLLFTLSLPFLFEMELILHLWLEKVPPNAELFCRLYIIVSLIEIMSNPYVILAKATGKIKLIQSVIGGLFILNLPISYVVLKMGFPAESVFYTMMIVSLMAFTLRLYLLKRVVDINIKSVFKYAVLKIALILSVLPIIIGMHYIVPQMHLFINFIFAPILSILVTYYLVLDKNERFFISNIIQNSINKKREQNV